MIRPAGIKIPAKYVPPSGFRNLPPPPAPPGVPSSQQKNIQGQLQKTSQSLSNSLNGATPPKPKQILSSSAGHASEPLPPSPSIQDTHTPHTTASTTQALSKTPSPAEPIATNNNPPPTPPSSPQENKEKEPESLDLNTCKVEDLLRVPSLPKRLAEAIVQYRETQGAFRSLADLLQVPEMTPIAYTLITGQEPPENYKSTKTIYAHLSIPNEQEINAKTIVERIAAWPDVVGCILSNHESRVIAANLIGTISAEKLASSAKQFTSLTQDQLSSIHQSKAQEIIIPGLSATFYFIAGPQAILTLIYSIPTPPARHLEILREIITQIEIQ
jgi:DNA uptake protein ComE-like DNA-binding protein/predicted regulator of Ras-like GTPase activity (Roadblock/LC7/MglB family)